MTIYTMDDLLAKIKESGKAYDVPKITAAFELADTAHADQKRVSGEPYITHPLAVAIILVELGMDTDSIVAALLHDVVEDTQVPMEQIEKQFGKDVGLLVGGVTKLGKIPFSSREDQQAENVRKMLLAMAQDVRVIIIKLADRLHNMRTLSAMRPHEVQKAPAAMLSEGMEQLKERLGAIMVYRKITAGKKILGCLAAVLIGWCAISAGAYASAEPSWSGAGAAPAAAPTGIKNVREAAAGPGNAAGQEDIAGQEGTGEQEHTAEQADSLGWKEKVTPYIQNTYYEYPYLMEIGWNIPEQKTADYPYSRIIRQTDGTDITCFFNEKTKQYMEDEAVIDSFIRLYPGLQKLGEQSNLAVKTPFFVSIRDVSGKTAAELAEESYYNGSLAENEHWGAFYTDLLEE